MSDFNSYEETLDDFFNTKLPILQNLKVEIGVMGVNWILLDFFLINSKKGPGAADENNVLRGVNLSDSWTIYGQEIEKKFQL